jgi:hypothetical protein
LEGSLRDSLAKAKAGTSSLRTERVLSEEIAQAIRNDSDIAVRVRDWEALYGEKATSELEGLLRQGSVKDGTLEGKCVLRVMAARDGNDVAAEIRQKEEALGTVGREKAAASTALETLRVERSDLEQQIRVRGGASFGSLFRVMHRRRGAA